MTTVSETLKVYNLHQLSSKQPIEVTLLTNTACNVYIWKLAQLNIVYRSKSDVQNTIMPETSQPEDLFSTVTNCTTSIYTFPVK